jgi:type IV pilus assembly protein PilV
MRGFSMVETLVSILVLTMGLLGHAAMSMRSLAANDSSGHRALAAINAAFISDLMRANRQSVVDGDYDIALSAPPPGGASRSNGDLIVWRALLAKLPSGDGAVQYDASNKVVRIVVSWNDMRGNQAASETSTTRTYEYSFRP